MSRLIDADKLAERIRDWGKSFYDFNVELALGCLMDEPTIDKWHYPSKGEYPPSGEEVLCLLPSGSSYVGFWDKEDKSWHFLEFYEEEIKCWQYIEPPKEEANKQCTNCVHYKNNVCERTKTHPNKPEEWTCPDWNVEEPVELKPCPFCGNEKVEIAETWNGRYHGKVVNCNYLDGGCGANSGSRETEAEAIEAWNGRAECTGQE